MPPSTESPLSVLLSDRATVGGSLLPSGRRDVRRAQTEGRAAVTSLAWPLVAWPVVMAPPVRSDFNPLERAVLRLAAGGVHDRARLAHFLGVAPEVVVKVWERLYDQRLVDVAREGRVTEEGERWVRTWRGESVGTEPLPVVDDSGGRSPVYGFLFRDLLGGHLCPLFLRELPKPLGRSAAETAHPLPFRPGMESRPLSPAAVREAMNRLDRIRLYASRYGESDRITPGDSGTELDIARDRPENPEAREGDTGDTLYGRYSDVDDQGNLRQSERDGFVHGDSEEARRWDRYTFRSLPDPPIRCDAEVFLYVPRHSPQEVYLTAPFGEFGGEWFRRRIQAAAQQHPPLNAFLEQQAARAGELFAPSKSYFVSASEFVAPFPAWDEASLEDLTEDPTADDGTVVPVPVVPVPEADPFQLLPEDLRALWVTAPAIPPTTGADPLLTDALEQWAKAGRILAKSQRDPDFQDQFFVDCQKALEAATLYLIRRVPARRELAHRLGSYERYDLIRRLERMAQRLGATLPPKMGSAADARKMHGMATRDGISLRDRCLFLLADAHDRPDAAFRRAVQSSPAILDWLDSVADLRNENAHYTPPASATSGTDSERWAPFRLGASATHAALTALLGALTTA